MYAAMPLTPFTSRDRLQQLLDLGRKTWRHGWLIAVFAVVGTALSLAFAIAQPRSYRSWSTVFYQQPIGSDLLLPGRKEAATRDLGDRYRELLLARPQLEQVVSDRSLDPFPDDDKLVRKLDKLRQAVRVVPHGAGTFRVEYTDRDPERARRVTEKLTQLLQDEEQQRRVKQAEQALAFAHQQEADQLAVLDQREQALTGFLAEHPEFAAASEHRSPQPSPVAAVDAQLAAKLRQIDRIQQRLRAMDGPAAAGIAPPDRHDSAAELRVAEARREVDAMDKALRALRVRLLDQHPSVIDAQRRLDEARAQLRLAEAAVPATPPPAIAATPDDRARLERELHQLEAEVAAMRAQHDTPRGAADPTAHRLAQLEVEYENLQRAAGEQRARVERLADVVFSMTLDANQKLAEPDGSLSVVDPAFEPLQPVGPGRSLVVMMGVLLFATLGLVLALGLAAVDDRLYRDVDLDRFNLRLLAVIPPAPLRARRDRRGARAAG
jgi:uncharacterized protein involved in exopolysaccharide biosynthesis